MAIKYFNIVHTEDLENEVSILKELQGGKCIPKLLGKGERWIATSPIGTLINDETNYSDFANFVDIIEYCHSKNIIHQDIRTSNMILTNDGPVLIDFGFSSKDGSSPKEYAGTLSTASNRVLKKMMSSFKFSVTKSDDLISLIKTMYITKDMLVEITISESDRDEPSSFISNWNKAIKSSSMNKFYKQLIKLAKGIDYSGLKKLILEIEEDQNIPTKNSVKDLTFKFSDDISFSGQTTTTTTTSAKKPTKSSTTTNTNRPKTQPNVHFSSSSKKLNKLYNEGFNTLNRK